MSQTMSTDIRQNEHLAVLLPRTLWKRDSLATLCDTFACSTVFSNIPALPSLSISSLSSMSLSNFNIARTERRHHCRKCGGVFCSACTSRTTPLLDTRSLPFLNPPRGSSIYDWGDVVENARVCDDCWDQLHGVASYGSTCPPSSPTSSTSSLSPATPALTLSTLSTLLPVSGDSSPASSTSPRTPPDTPLLTLNSSASSLPSLATLGPSLSKRTRATSSTSSTSTPVSRRSSVVSRTSNPDLRRRATLHAASASTHKDKDESPLPVGELRAYPLCRASTLCKASGGGRWTPGPELAREEERVFTDYSDYSPLSASPTSDSGLYTPYSSYSLFSPITSKPSSPTSSASSRRRSTRSNPAPTLGIGKPLWQVEWESEVRRAERRRENPVVRTGPNGEFCVRVYSNSSRERMAMSEDDDERPATIPRSFSLSTF